MTNIGEAIYRENMFFNAVINIVLAVVLGGICIAIPAYGAAALESEILGIATYVAFIAALGFVALVVIHSLFKLYKETRQSVSKQFSSDRSDKVANLRDKYTRGEINEQELEMKMENILNDIDEGNKDESEVEAERILHDSSEAESTDQNVRR